MSPYVNDDIFAEKLKYYGGISILSFNCRSLNASIYELKVYLDRLLSEKRAIPTVMCLQETWLQKSDYTMQHEIVNYNLLPQGWTATSKGGLAIYVHKSYHFEPFPIVNNNTDLWEGLFIKLETGPNMKNIIIGNIYRAARYLNEQCRTFIDDFSNTLDNFDRWNGELVIGGDTNIDLLKIKTWPIAEEFFEMMCGHGLLPRITHPTRITEYSKSLIDNIFVKVSMKSIQANYGILTHCFSDHNPCFVVFQGKSEKTKRNSVQYKRQYSLAAVEKFNRDIADGRLLDVLDPSLDGDPDVNYSRLNQLINDLRNKYFPFIRVKHDKHHELRSPWITPGLVRSIATRDDLHWIISNTVDVEIKSVLKLQLANYNKVLRRLLKKTWRQYIYQRFETTKNDVKKTWVAINNLLNRTKKSQFPNEFNIDGQSVSDPNIIADKFNEYFSEVASTLASNIGESSVAFESFLQTPSPQLFDFVTVNSDKVSEAIDSIKSKSSAGHDEMSSRSLKNLKNCFLEPLCIIFNQCIRKNIFPDNLKIAKVKPLFKKADNTRLENYRPISLLPAISKVFERLIHNQLVSYFEENNLFYKFQYGYRKYHSTEFAAAHFVDSILKNLDVDIKTISVYMDLSKAFDTLDYSILLYKLRYYGLSESALLLLKSYLSNRKQYIDFNGTKSTYRDILAGVPQGSILGPLLFIIYVNDIGSVSKIFEPPILYADDTTLSYHPDPNENSEAVSLKLNQELEKFNDWFKANKLSLNLSKTQFMIFQRPRAMQITANLKINEVAIERIYKFNFLGLNVNFRMDWIDHKQIVNLKLSKSVGILRRFKYCLPRSTLLTIYFSLVLSHINYMNSIWGFDLNEEEIHLKQKAAVRAISKSHFLAHTEPLLKELGLLDVTDIHRLSLTKFYCKFMKRTLPAYFLEEFMYKKHSQQHLHYTRICNRLIPPDPHKDYVLSNIRYSVIKCINKLPDFIYNMIEFRSVHCVAWNYKIHLLRRYKNFCNIINCYVCNRIARDSQY